MNWEQKKKALHVNKKKILEILIIPQGRKKRREVQTRPMWLSSTKIDLSFEPFSSFFCFLFFFLCLCVFASSSPAPSSSSSSSSDDAVQQFRTTLHQLYERKTTAILQSSYVHLGTRRIRTRGYSLDFYRFWYGLAVDDRFDRKGKAESSLIRERSARLIKRKILAATIPFACFDI